MKSELESWSDGFSARRRADRARNATAMLAQNLLARETGRAVWGGGEARSTEEAG
jgi:hypothetical protein